MRPLRFVVAALVATATLTVPLAAATVAGPAQATERAAATALKVKLRNQSFSPNGDRSHDRARVRFVLAKKSAVTLKVRRTNKARTLVTRARLGTHTSGRHTWRWNGKNRHGRVVRDGRYLLDVVADQVRTGKKAKVRSVVDVDTRLEVDEPTTVSSDTVYPHTTVTRDWVGISVDDDDVAALVMTVKNSRGRTVYTTDRIAVDPYYSSTATLFAGMINKRDPLPAGRYRLRFRVWDHAGNQGKAPGVAVHVSDRPLVEAAGSLTLPPTGAHTASGAPTPQPTTRTRGTDGRESTTVGQNEPRPVPCGTVVPSQIYPDPGAMSFRSADTCGGTYQRPSVAAAGGTVTFDTLTPQVAPRGLSTSQVSMRGRPTNAGETDTALLFARGVSWYYYTQHADATSAPAAEETVTTAPTKSYPWEPPYLRYVRSVDWSVATHGTDSYDVADVTVHYTYLTPQPS